MVDPIWWYNGHDAEGEDLVNHPPHYTSHPSGVECITITEHMGFCLGNALKYIWRADLKHDALEDLKKAQWYLTREVQRRMIDIEGERLDIERSRAHGEEED